jgi:hypothetical protein
MSVDPLAEKYPNISSYVYCADNPVKFVDPTGMNIYNVNKAGTITCVKQTKDIFDMLYTSDDYNKKRINGKKIENQNILSDLANGKHKDAQNWPYKNADVESNKHNDKDVFDVFKLCADFTHGEWEMLKYKKNGKDRLWIGSFFGSFSNGIQSINGESSPNYSDVGLNNVTWGIHSHGLNVSQATLSEIWKGMGYLGKGRYKSDYDVDMVLKKQFPYSYYIYSAPAKQIYFINPSQAEPIFIKSVNSSNDLNLSK